MSLAMSKAEREAFLAGVHVGVVSIEEPGRGPLTVPIWYAFEDGDVVWVTGKHSRKGALLSDGTRISLCAQTEAPPYKYVSVEGPITLERPDYERHIRAIAYRYLGPEQGERYLGGNSEGRNLDNEVLVRLKPERWLTVDYGKM
jgi:nitroimidazol reductase NimA-like FMN-containing flavoprotein (pyridoxamine 5'-phosphate oxidase superfamily)